MTFIESLLLLLVLSRALGEVAGRFGQPAMLGEIAAGILLGPSCLTYIHYTPEIKAIADIGVLLLVFMAGMEMDLPALWDSFRGRRLWVSAAGFVIPLLFGIVVGRAFGLDSTRTIFIGLCIAITALPVSVRILMDLGKLQTDIGQKIIGAAVMNDVISLLMLGVIVDVKGAGPVSRSLLVSLGLALLKAVVFMVGFVAVSRLIKRHSAKRFLRSRNLVD